MIIEDKDDDLQRRQVEHLGQVRKNAIGSASDCLHNQCPECVGTGIKKNGGSCIHGISCPCPRCTPRC